MLYKYGTISIRTGLKTGEMISVRGGSISMASMPVLMVLLFWGGTSAIREERRWELFW